MRQVDLEMRYFISKIKSLQGDVFNDRVTWHVV